MATATNLIDEIAKVIGLERAAREVLYEVFKGLTENQLAERILSHAAIQTKVFEATGLTGADFLEVVPGPEQLALFGGVDLTNPVEEKAFCLAAALLIDEQLSQVSRLGTAH
jgi:hypothetical protein